MAASRKKGLGKGLDILIPVNKNIDQAMQTSEKISSGKESDEKKGVLMVKLNKVEPNSEQPRKNFEEDALIELSDSIKQFGILEPLLVRKKDNFYEIVAGERRWRAARLAGLKEVPVIVKDFSDKEVIEIGLIENIQRENLNPIEEARAFRKLIDEFHLKQDEIAERVSKSRTAISNSMRLLNLDERVQQMLIDEMLSTGHARALLVIEDKDEQYKIATQIFDEKLSVRETEKLVKALKNPKKQKEKINPENDYIYRNLEEQMRDVIGTKVNISSRSKGKGKIEIEYYSEQELEHVFDLIMSLRREV